MDGHFENYRLSDALMCAYKLVWDDFCAWYLELVKPAYQSPIESETLETAKGFFQKILALVHPFMPFLTEELWHDELFGERAEEDCVIVAEYPRAQVFDETVVREFDVVRQIVSEVRNIRNAKGISPKTALPLAINASSAPEIDFAKYRENIAKLANVPDLTFVREKTAGALAFLVGRTECYLRLGGQNIDPIAERERVEKEIEYLRGFLASVDKKLSNARFVQNAKPEVVRNERNKKADAEAKIRVLEESLHQLTANS